MKFSGHETFHIREGWLHKGLELLSSDPRAFQDQYVHDKLGVGSNMAKSIRHWLQATGLVETKEKGELLLTQLAQKLREKDPYFEDPFTWWILHVQLVCNETGATTWHWFFNRFGQKRFVRETCLSSLRKYAASTRKVSPNTLERDVSTFLSSYAKSVPIDPDVDPEDSYDCPFQDLELMTEFRSTRVFRVNDGAKQLPPEALGYSLAKCVGVHSGDSFDHIVGSKNSPNRCFCISPTQLFELVEKASDQLGSEIMRIDGLAGQRTVKYESQDPLEWVEDYFFHQDH